MTLLSLQSLCCAVTLHFWSLPCAAHPDGTLEYNAHNLYGTSMARHFHNTYKDITGKRVFLLTRYACRCSHAALLQYGLTMMSSQCSFCTQLSAC